MINNIDQVYQSDIFYLKVAGKGYYGVTIIDAYSMKTGSPAFVQQSTGYRKYRRFEKAVAVKN